jgi:hypothetical protein
LILVLSFRDFGSGIQKETMGLPLLSFRDFDSGIQKETMGLPLLSFRDFDSGIQKKGVGEKYFIQININDTLKSQTNS